MFPLPVFFLSLFLSFLFRFFDFLIFLLIFIFKGKCK